MTSSTPPSHRDPFSEGVYSRVSRRTSDDARFRSLSRPKPNGQSLWLHLLTGPHNTRIPGLFSIGPMGLAERLRWSVQGTKKALAELVGADMVAFDGDALLVWLPNAVRHNPPSSPDAVLDWARTWRAMPESPLLEQAYQGIAEDLATLGDAYVRAFEMACKGALPPSSAEGAPKAQVSDLTEKRRAAGLKGLETQKRRRAEAAGLPVANSGKTDVLPPGKTELATGNCHDGKVANAIEDQRAGGFGEQDQEKEREPDQKQDQQVGQLRAPEPARASGTFLANSLTPAAQTILDALAKSGNGSLVEIATPQFAHQLAGWTRVDGHMGKLDVADVVRAITIAAENEQGGSATTSGPRTPRTLASYVLGILRDTRRGDGSKPLEENTHRSGGFRREDRGPSVQPTRPHLKPAWKVGGLEP